MGLALDRMGTRYAPAVTLVMLSGSLLLAGWVASTVGVVLYAVWLGLQSGMVRTLGAALLRLVRHPPPRIHSGHDELHRGARLGCRADRLLAH